jgi:hypothetical protein
MAQITIEGSKTTPTTFLAPGRRITVERTDYINKLLSRGYVNLVEQPKAEVPAEPEAEVKNAPKIEAPAESAAKSVWADFLGIEDSSQMTKAEMIEEWNARKPVD